LKQQQQQQQKPSRGAPRPTNPKENDPEEVSKNVRKEVEEKHQEAIEGLNNYCGDSLETNENNEKSEPSENDYIDATTSFPEVAFEENQDPFRLLEQTKWEVQLDVGLDDKSTSSSAPESGTVLGEQKKRLKLNLKVKFSNEEVMDADVAEHVAFMEADSGFRKLEILECHQVTTPTTKSRSVRGDTGASSSVKRIPTKSGVWIVDPELGADALRFYFDVPMDDDESSTPLRESEMTFPNGRIFCSCGYFAREKDMERHPSEEEGLYRSIVGDTIWVKGELNETESVLQDEVTRHGAWVDFVFGPPVRAFRREVQRIEEHFEEATENEMIKNPPESCLERPFSKGILALSKKGNVHAPGMKIPFTSFVAVYDVVGKLSMRSLDKPSSSPPKNTMKP